MVKLEIPSKSTYFLSDKLSPLEMFKFIFDRSDFTAKLIGCNIFSQSYTPVNQRFFHTVGVILSMLLVHFYDIYIFRTDLVRVCFILVTLGFALQGFMKVKTFVLSRNKIVDLRDRCERFLTNFNTKETNEMFESWLMISCHIGVSLFALFFVCDVLFVIYPIIYYLFTGQKVLHCGFELPWIDWQTSLLGYATNFFYTVFLCYTALFGFFVTFFLHILFVLMILGQFDLLKMMLEELNDMIKSNKNGSKNDDIRKQIKLTVELHSELLRYKYLDEDYE
jgi:hypothetical protein